MTKVIVIMVFGLLCLPGVSEAGFFMGRVRCNYQILNLSSFERDVSFGFIEPPNNTSGSSSGIRDLLDLAQITACTQFFIEMHKTHNCSQIGETVNPAITMLVNGKKVLGRHGSDDAQIACQ